MFTGLVETVGRVVRASGSAPRRLTIRSSIPAAEVKIGDSVAIDGCCLTVVATDADTLSFEAADETLARTTLGALKAGDGVHLERALAASGRLDGHLVMGHVDAVGRVRTRRMKESALYLGVAGAPEVAALCAPRGSIAIAGVSLTVTEVNGDEIFVALVPHTVAKTTLGEARAGTALNLEADVLARYVARVLKTTVGIAGGSDQGGGLTVEYLKDKGFL